MPITPHILTKLLTQRQNGHSKLEIHAHRTALVRGHSIILAADNHYVANRPSSHSEVTALDKLVRRGNKKYDCYVVRTGEGDWGGNSRPCFHCLQALADSNIINRVVFTNGTDYSVSTVNKLLNESDQHISSGHKHFCCHDDDEDDDEDNKPNLEMII